MISINLYYCCEKVIIHASRWMIGKVLMKHHYQKKKMFTAIKTLKDITAADYKHEERVIWFVCSKQCIIASCSIWKFSRYVPENI